MDLKHQILLFKENIENKTIKNEKNLVYLRLSKLDNSIKDKERQILEAITKLEADYNKLCEVYPQLLEQGFILFVEVESAYKNTTRKEFINMYDNYLFNNVRSVRDILEGSTPKKETSIFLTSFDRLSRVFFYSLTFQMLRILMGIKINSLDSDEIALESKYNKLTNESYNDQLVYVFQLMISSANSQRHSEDFSHKVKRRVSKDNKGVTISNKTGNKWGVDRTISDKMRAKISKQFNYFTAKEISQQVGIYQDLTKTKKRISINTIYKIIKEERKEND